MFKLKKFFLLTFTFSLVFISCKNNTSEKAEKTVVSKEKKVNLRDSVPEENLKEKSYNDEDCIFDQKTQNDDFLKKIDELKNYSWNPKTKKATIIISEKETLEIFRGGCDDFMLNAEFIVSKEITFKENKNFIFSKISWISKLIYSKSDSKIISECLKNKYSVDDSNPNDIHINLMDNEIYNSFTIFYNSKDKNYNKFSIEYYLN